MSYDLPNGIGLSRNDGPYFTGREFYYVVNLADEWRDMNSRNKQATVMEVYEVIQQLCLNEYDSSNNIISITYEDGSGGSDDSRRLRHPHLNVYIGMEDLPERRNVNMDLLSTQLHQQLRNTLVGAKDAVIQKVYDPNTLASYMVKERGNPTFMEYGSWFDNIVNNDEDGPPPARRQRLDESPGASPYRTTTVDPDRKEIVEMRAWPVTRWQQFVEDNYNDGKITTEEAFEDWFESHGFLTTWVNHKSKLLDILVHKRRIENRRIQARAIKNASPDSFMYWLEWVKSQPRAAQLLYRFSLALEPRDPGNDRNQACVLKGAPGCGKTWILKYLDSTAQVGRISLNERGVGRFETVLKNDIIILDDPNRRGWVQKERETVLALFSGDKFSVKVHSHTETTEEPKHVFCTLNELPEVFPGELRRRMDIFEVHEYRRPNVRKLPVPYNHQMIIEYLKKGTQYFKNGYLPCACLATKNAINICSLNTKAPCKILSS